MQPEMSSNVKYICWESRPDKAWVENPPPPTMSGFFLRATGKQYPEDIP